MPELPEVEVTRRGISPHLIGATIVDVRLSGKALRWPLAADAAAHLAGQEIVAVDRRANIC